jgi:hypothetical protein
VSRPDAYIRGHTVAPADSGIVRRVTTWVLIASLVGVAIALAVSAATRHSREASLIDHAVTVSVIVTGCVGEATGTGIQPHGFTCRGAFVLDGRSHTDVIEGTTALLRPGQAISGATDSTAPTTLYLATALPRASNGWQGYGAPAALAVTAGLLVPWARRRRARVPTAG